MPTILVREEDWLLLGLKKFAAGGVDALKVEQMAKELQCSKSSFYWYFKNRDAFIEKLFGYWVTVGTASLIEAVGAIDPMEARLKALLTMVFAERRGKDFMFYLRQFTQQEPKYAPLLNTLESERIDYLALLLTHLGAAPTIAREKAHIVYHAYLGWYERHKFIDISDGDVETQVMMLIRHLNLFADDSPKD